MSERRWLLLALLPGVLFGCVTAPYTGRSQLMIVSESQEVGLGAQAYRQTLRDNVVSDNAEALRIVRKVGERIARAANKPDYKWEFRVFDDPEQVNAFCLPGGKVGVYTGIFPIARDEAGLAVIVGHEVAHALLRHAGERISRVQLIGTGLGLVGATGMNPTLVQALGLGASVGLLLPFSRSQESEADKVGLILMAKAGYDPRTAIFLWERMEQKQKGAPPEFLSTHPSSGTRVEELRAYMPEALGYYQSGERNLEKLPSPQELDSPKAKMERDLVKRIQAVNQLAQQKQGERAVAEAIGSNLRMDLMSVAQERQQLQLGYGQYAALRGVSYLGKSSLRQVLADYQNGERWYDLSERSGTRLPELISWMNEVQRAASQRSGSLR
jgi:metalloendopeptidase OMA1, mitochondrial